MKISNPVLTGFNADPSMIRVGDTYYIANSTFEWWPGVRLHASRDLAHWKLLPSPLTRVSQVDMRGNPSSGGVWAPDLSYADGIFYLVYADVKIVNGAFKDGTNYVVTARNIEGPWTDPVRLNGVGFDASLFHDDDGRKYIVQQTWDFREWHHAFNGITLTELDTATMKLKPETARRIWKGSQVKITEGPHIYKINGYYYLFAAEGGTQYEHQESVARSRTLETDSFESMPGNPFISNFDTPDSYLQKQGHGALVDTPAGEWYYASLCARPWWHDPEPRHGVRGWCTLGRETSIQKVGWTEDGWPYVEGGHGGQRYVEVPAGAPGLSGESASPSLGEGADDDHSCRDDFAGDQLDINWNTPRVPFSQMGTVGAGKLTLIGKGSLSNEFDLSLVARRWQAFNFDVETRVTFKPYSYMQMAGLTNYYNTACWSWAFITWDEKRGKRVIDVVQNDFYTYTTYLRDKAIEIPDDCTSVCLRSRIRTSSYSYEYSFNGANWLPIPVTLDAAILSDDHVAQQYGGFFTGAFTGMAVVDLSGYDCPADFSYFDYRELPGRA